MDQMDFTGPFEILSAIPNSTFHLIWKEKRPIRDMHGLLLTPTTTMAVAPPLDLLLRPDGHGQEQLMDDEEVLEFQRWQARGAPRLFSVCTGALTCGAAGLLRGVRATTHWSCFHVLEYFGAIAVDERVLVDGKHVSTAGVSSGGVSSGGVSSVSRRATRGASTCGGRVAQMIQLGMQYASEPPFRGGTPKTARPEILAACEEATGRSLRRGWPPQRESRRLGVLAGAATESR